LIKKLCVIGIVGTGFIAQGLARAIRRSNDFKVGSVLTRRKKVNIPDFHDDEIVSSIEALIEKSEIIVECSGDPLHATDVIEHAIAAKRKIVTMSSAWHVIAGSYYRTRGYITEAEGDQPGSLAALAEDGKAMGFDPLVYVNVKGFLNLSPTCKTMAHFSKIYGISLPQVTSFTDGTKLQLEQALVANGFGADIYRQGMLGPTVSKINKGLDILSKAAANHGKPIVDYVLTQEAPGAVMIIAHHDSQESVALGYLKMGDGPFYRLVRPYHLCHLEIMKTLRRTVAGGNILMDNGSLPTISVATITKHRLMPGDRIKQGIGSFDARGECVRILENHGHLPIALMRDIIIKRKIAKGEIIMRDDVELPESRALQAWLATEEKVIHAGHTIGAVN
jgi:predicted homoserine dehydrogenase-like protein